MNVLHYTWLIRKVPVQPLCWHSEQSKWTPFVWLSQFGTKAPGTGLPVFKICLLDLVNNSYVLFHYQYQWVLWLGWM